MKNCRRFCIPVTTAHGRARPESIRVIYHLATTQLPANPLELDADQTPFGMKCSIPVIPPGGE